MQNIRKIIQIDEALCDGCGQCVPGCAEGALQIVDGKARMVAERYCDGLGACLGECPTGALTLIERPAEDFDPEAVEAHLAALEKQAASSKPKSAGCPSQALHEFSSPCACASQPQTLSAGPPAAPFNRPPVQSAGPSALGHWPIKIRLVPPEAPFLNNAHLLVTADCVAAAWPDFNRSQLAGKVLLMGCPKFDNAQEYIARFRDIFRQAAVQKITVLIMEVPCCKGLPVIVQKGLEAAGKDIPLEVQVITRRGELMAQASKA